METYTALALAWLVEHPHPEAVTSNPSQWAEEINEAILQRIRGLVEQLAPPTLSETYLQRWTRLATAQQSAVEVAVNELLPQPPTEASPTGWAPLVPDLSDLL